MTREEITQILYESKEINSALLKINPPSIREELKQEIFLSLCSITDEKFWSIYHSKGVNGVPFYGVYSKSGMAGLQFWVVRCMLNMVYSTSLNQPFYRNFRAKYESLDGLDNLYEEIDESKNDKELLFNKIEQGRKELSWYEDRMLDTYMDLNFNQTEVSRRTQIPYQSVVKTIKIIKDKLRQ